MSKKSSGRSTDPNLAPKSTSLGIKRQDSPGGEPSVSGAVRDTTLRGEHQVSPGHK